MEFKIILNRERISSLKEFAALDGRCSNMEKPTVCVVQAGTNDENELCRMIEFLDKEMCDDPIRKRQGYLRTGMLDSYLDSKERDTYTGLFQRFQSQKGSDSYFTAPFLFRFDNPLWDRTYKRSLMKILEEYDRVMQSEVKLRNFALTLFKWITIYFPGIFKGTKTLSCFPKFLYTGIVKTNECLFFRLLSLCGCDVYAISLQREMNVKAGDLLSDLCLIHCSGDIKRKIEPYDPQLVLQRLRQEAEAAVKIPSVPPSAVRVPVTSTPNRAIKAASVQPSGPPGKPLEYEELAKLASSIVMITVMDGKGKTFASGSGVLVNNQGYILTNFHVVRDGVSYGVQLEEEQELRYTTELVKYHPNFDLALLRVDPLNRKPIPLYRGPDLARGQKVVAIGSPLGLFNTVSDGIIAGFRNVNDIPMIQFTAPTSHGSSGGALLNLCGELVGIVTAGFDDGQNLNLAVDYDTVRGFLRGFVS